MKRRNFQYIFFLVLGREITPLCHFRDVLINGSENLICHPLSLREKSEFKEFSQAVSFLSCQADVWKEGRKEGSRNTGLTNMVGA